MIKKLSILALILLLIGVIGSIFTVSTLINPEEQLEERIIDTSDFTNIQIDTDNAKVAISPSDDDKAKVELDGNILEHDMETNVEGDTLKIKVKTKFNKLFSFDFFSKALSLHVYVPEKQYDNIDIKSKNGKLTIMELAGDHIKLSASNGGINVNGVQGEIVLLETSNGRIEVKDVIAQLVEVDTNNGKVNMDHIDAEIIGKANNGAISLKTDYLDQSIDLHADNGKINIQSANKPQNATLDLKTDNGSINVFGEKNWDTVIGNGENIIKVETSNGSITITQ